MITPFGKFASRPSQSTHDMGCDIHIILECKHHDTWVGVTQMGYLPEHAIRVTPTRDRTVANYRLKERDYEFFWRLAGVRSGEGPGGIPRGYPENASSLSDLLIGEDSDLHSHSWTSLRELIPILMVCKEDMPINEVVAHRLGSDKDAQVALELKVARDWIGDDVDDAFDNWRIVYAFDN